MSVVLPAVFTADAALACDSVTKVFPVIDEGTSWRVMLGYADVVHGIRALDGVSLSVPKGKLCGMLGRNGAGKSTLLRVMGGVYAPTRGAVRVEGRLSALFELGGMGNRQMTGREFARRSLALQGARGRQFPADRRGARLFGAGPAFDEGYSRTPRDGGAALFRMRRRASTRGLSDRRDPVGRTTQISRPRAVRGCASASQVGLRGCW